MSLSLRFAARSDVGLVRDGNEDSAYAGPRLLAVADGMGGHAAGEVASSVVVATLAPLDDDVPGPDLLDALAEAVDRANTHLRDMMSGDDALSGMGTTLTALLWSGQRIGLVHIGDSRAYVLRDGEFSQITHDHTFVQSLVDEGRITAEEAGHHPQRSLITNALDGRDEFDLDLSVREVRAGDRFLVCSDGLSGVVSVDTLAETLAEGEPAVAVEALVRLALRAGGPDNVTCVVADVVDVESRPSDVPLVVGAAGEGPEHRTASDTAAGRAAALNPTAEADDPGDGDDAPARRRAGPLLLLVAMVLVVMGAGGYGAWAWSQSQYYVGADSGRVAIFRGLSQTVAGVDLGHRYESQAVRLADLPEFQRERVTETIDAGSLPDARRIVSTLDEQARRCIAARMPSPSPSPSPSPTASPRRTPGRTSSPSPSPRPTVTRTPTRTPTPRPTPATGCDEATP